MAKIKEINLNYPEGVETERVLISATKVVHLSVEPFTPRVGWWNQGSCAGVDREMTGELHTERGRTIAPILRKYCNDCRMRGDCLEEAVQNPNGAIWGIWGGLSERDRRGVRRYRLLTQVAVDEFSDGVN